MQPRWRKRCVGLLSIPILAAGLWLAWNAVAVATSTRLYFVPTASMAPTLGPGDRILVDSRLDALPRRGEIWVFHMPTPGLIGVKRIVGLPGETVEVAGGRVLVDGRPVAEPFAAGPINYAMPPMRLRAGQFFVLGDNRNKSLDSHVWGPLEQEKLIGRVHFRPWPPSRIGGL